MAGTKDWYFAYYNINITLGSTNEKCESLSLGIIMYSCLMEIIGCNNLVSYKVATRLKISWISNVFYLVATLLNGCKHLVTTLK